MWNLRFKLKPRVRCAFVNVISIKWGEVPHNSVKESAKRGGVPHNSANKKSIQQTCIVGPTTLSLAPFHLSLAIFGPFEGLFGPFFTLNNTQTPLLAHLGKIFQGKIWGLFINGGLVHQDSS